MQKITVERFKMIYHDYVFNNGIKREPDLPLIPKLPTPIQQKYCAQCEECGRLIPNGPDYYCCMNYRCPVQIKPIFFDGGY